VNDLRIILQPKQLALLQALEATGPDIPIRWGWGGARGAAKSGGLRRIAMVLAFTYPQIVVVIIRKHFGDLMENHVEKMLLEYPEFHSRYWHREFKQWVLPNGSRIKLAYGDTAKDIKEFARGPEMTFVFVDQAEQFSEAELVDLTIPNRWPGAEENFAKSCFFFNPGGPGTEFLRRVFHQRNFREGEVPGRWAFVQAYGWDNYEWFRNEVDISCEDFYELDSETRFELFIKTSYGRVLNELPQSLRIGELLGSFEHFSGQYFADVWGDHCILTVKQIEAIVQPWWRRWMAQDWGFGDHDAHGWFVTGKISPEQWVKHFGGECEWPMDIVMQVREHVIAGRAEGDLGMDIVRMTPEPERKFTREFFLSQDAHGQRAKQTQIHGKHTVGAALSSILEAHGLPAPSTANQDRVNGWRFMFGCLRQAGLRGHVIDADRAKQGPAFFISANCPRTIESIPLAVRDDDKPEDVMRVAGAVWEDVTDMIRYGLMSALDPKKKAPVEVRAAEILAAAKSPTEAHLRMLHFKQEENRQRTVARSPRWR
jgi:hypothetical protein